MCGCCGGDVGRDANQEEEGRPLSRRAMLGGIVGSAGAVGALQSLTPTAEAASLPPGPAGLRAELAFARKNSTDQAVVVKRGAGGAVSFGDHLVTFDPKTRNLVLVRGSRRIASGRASETFTGEPYTAGSRYQAVMTVAAGGRRVVRTTELTARDSEARAFDVALKLGRPGRDPSLTRTFLYDAVTRSILGRSTRVGKPPGFDYAALAFAGGMMRRFVADSGPGGPPGDGSQPIPWVDALRCIGCGGAGVCCIGAQPECCFAAIDLCIGCLSSVA